MTAPATSIPAKKSNIGCWLLFGAAFVGGVLLVWAAAFYLGRSSAAPSNSDCVTTTDTLTGFSEPGIGVMYSTNVDAAVFPVGEAQIAPSDHVFEYTDTGVATYVDIYFDVPVGAYRVEIRRQGTAQIIEEYTLEAQSFSAPLLVVLCD